MPSLREIESTISTLWLDESARRWLLTGQSKGALKPECLSDAPESVLAEADHEGIKLYASLLNFGHHDVMDSVYPFCQRLLGKRWEAVVDDYLLKFPPDHYNFNRLCSRFSEYCTEYGGELLKKSPFLPELADYEWIELEKMEAGQEITVSPQISLADPALLASHAPVFNPTLTVRQYKYDVPSIAERIENGQNPPRSLAPEQTFVAIYRHPESHMCRFVALESGAAELLQTAMKDSLSYQDLIQLSVRIAGDCNPIESVQDFLELIDDFEQTCIITGSRSL